MLIGVDAGTSVVKAVAFTNDGEAVRVAARPTGVISPIPGYAEQDLEELLAAVGAVIQEAAQDDSIELVGVTGQGDGVWLLDHAGRQVRRPILWSDARASALVTEWIDSGVAEEAFRRSGNMPFPGAAAPLLAWLDNHEPESLRAAATAAYCKDAIVQRLTGVRGTEASDASLPFLDPHARRYDETLLDLYGVATWKHLLAPIDPPATPPLPLSAEGAALTGLPTGTLVHRAPFDFGATMIGAGMTRPGDALIILGTTLGCALLTDRIDTNGEAAGMLLCMPRPDLWARVMPAMVGTPTLDWMLRIIGATHDDVDTLLAASAPGANGVMTIPYFAPAGERAPFVDPAARGQVVGLSLESTPADLVRSVCEGIALAARHCLESGGLRDNAHIFLGGGGVRSSRWRQVLADVLQRPLILARQPETGARGAALAGLVAAGRDPDLAAWTRPGGVIEPDRALAAHADAAASFYREQVQASRGRWRGPVMKPMHQ
ncbi:MAG: FGGY-family carbohydrate kinase [Thermomicrobiales bacterium]